MLTEHIGDPELTSSGDDGPDDRYIHDRDMQWLKSSDVMIAEVTTVSLGVGYEIGRAVESGKKVLCLYRKIPGKKLSAMIAGCPSLITVCYEHLDELKLAILNYLKTG